MLPLQQGWLEWSAVVKMGECSSLCSPQICPLADILGQQEHLADVLPCHNDAYKLWLCSTIVIDNVRGVCIGMLQLLSDFAAFFISP